jgi:tetratricopeptide (TPR) repeat protein
MSDDSTKRQMALDLVNRGLAAQQSGDLQGALALYRQSIAVEPTAEAHTFIGWVLSFDDNYLQEAIDQCREAIAVDPNFGNPYNDIGVYLMRLGRFDEAIPWLERAKEASRYEPRHFPYLNLGNIYLLRGHLGAAIKEFEEALRYAPDDRHLNALVAEVRSRLN